MDKSSYRPAGDDTFELAEDVENHNEGMEMLSFAEAAVAYNGRGRKDTVDMLGIQDDYTGPNISIYDAHPRMSRKVNREKLTKLMESGDNYGTVDNDLKIAASTAATGTGYNFGWIEGVYIRCTLSIFGVMMFLRLNWMVSEAGVGGSIGVIIWSVTVTSITTMSLSALATNGRVKAGGVYYMVSRSLGADIGVVVGLTVYIAQSMAVALNLVGFAEAIVSLQSSYMVDEVWDPKIWGFVALVCMFGSSFLGAAFEVGSQKVLAVLMALALGSFFIGCLANTGDDSIGATGLSDTSFSNNSPASYSSGVTWITVLGVFFPAATGIAAGASISGDLADPQDAIPKGTFLAIATTTLIYISMLLFLAASFDTESIGDITNQIAAVDIAIVPGMAYAGLFAASLSTALALMVGAPRALMAVARDDILPFLAPWKVGYFSGDEPLRGYMLTLSIAFVCILLLDLNQVAPIVTNFYLVQYALVNYSVTSAHFAKSPGWRPTFRYYSPWISLLGTMMCLASMFMINYATAIATIAVSSIIYQYVRYSKPVNNWGESASAKSHITALESLFELENAKEHVKNYRPQYLVMAGNVDDRLDTLNFMKLLRKGGGSMIVGNIINGDDFVEKLDEYDNFMSSTVLANHGILGFKAACVAPSLLAGTTILLQTVGVGKMRPNTMIIGFKCGWKTASKDSLLDYWKTIRVAFASGHAVGIIRNAKLARTMLEGELKSTIDVWWLVEDGGLTLLQAHLLLRHPEFKNRCTLRVFSAVPNENMIEGETKKISELLLSFRIPAEVTVVCTAGDPRPATKQKFADMSHETDLGEARAVYFMNLSDQIEKHSRKASMVITSIPVPRTSVPVRKYFTYLELLSGERPTLMIRGNQQTVLTYNS